MELLAVDIDGGEVEMERKRERPEEVVLLDRQIYFFAIYVLVCILD